MVSFAKTRSATDAAVVQVGVAVIRVVRREAFFGARRKPLKQNASTKMKMMIAGARDGDTRRATRTTGECGRYAARRS